MARLARLDLIGVLQHVMVRGIEKRDIFLDDQDRRRFLLHLSELLVKTDTVCLAWCLMGNHVHLLLRPQKSKLGIFMRRLLTSYALGFNVRHERVGHLFQNRFKSIVCEEERYLLELVRYIHLNPIRGGIIHGGRELASYPWTGHAVLMGEAELEGQVTWEVLSRFGGDTAEGRKKYHSFVMEGLDAGRRDALGSGGEIRDPYLIHGGQGEESFDSRVLGSGDFVEQLWGDQEQQVPEHKVSVPILLELVASAFDLDASCLRQPNKTPTISQARAVACFIAVRELGYSGVAISKALGITPAGVTLAADRGATIIKGEKCRDLLLHIRNLNS